MSPKGRGRCELIVRPSMLAILKLLADVFHLTDAVRSLASQNCAFAGVACVIWALIANRVMGTILWLAVVGVATFIGVIWDRKTNAKTIA
jgi:hypothetical protein